MNYYGHKGLDKFLYEKYFLNKKDGLAIECGALDGIYLSTCKTLEEIGWQCVNIEANPDLFANLVKNRPQSKNLNVALSDQDGISIFESGAKTKNGHLVGASGVLPRLKVETAGYKKFQVKTMTYKAVIESLAIKHVDLFVLDVEGWEVPVFRGMANCEVIPDVLCVESCPSVLKVVSYDDVIAEVFKGQYKKHSTCWINDIYIREKK